MQNPTMELGLSFHFGIEQMEVKFRLPSHKWKVVKKRWYSRPLKFYYFSKVSVVVNIKESATGQAAIASLTLTASTWSGCCVCLERSGLRRNCDFNGVRTTNYKEMQDDTQKWYDGVSAEEGSPAWLARRWRGIY
ncbi:hypothetical protein PIB30_063410 [Stylosanthes scabra]|uniref:Uncharacterized protein n=1 Tax=Stylosanthes scabra TaxID=79078 RepID=A0ABU6SLH1_9FABA|nr:hypothetical protein [Stylosanthes scabra]